MKHNEGEWKKFRSIYHNEAQSMAVLIGIARQLGPSLNDYLIDTSREERIARASIDKLQFEQFNEIVQSYSGKQWKATNPLFNEMQ